MSFIQKVRHCLAGSRASNIIRLLEQYQKKHGDFTLVETGSIRNTSVRYQKDDGHSTKHICEFVKRNPGCTFYSVDLETGTCDAYLKTKGLREYVHLVQGNSLDVLPTLDFDIAYLDSDNDSELILKEFMIAKNKARLIIVDDVDPTDASLKKGIEVTKYLDSNHLPYILLPRQLVFWNDGQAI